ncbi:MAG: hypothetical protein QF398_04980, partial [Alphaproteobacteria bacterium]|nr:hypothetical protein [Alphaproteobacteria bacterium]
RKQVTDTADLGLDAEIKETLDPSGSFDDTFDFDLDEAVARDTKPIDEVIEAPADTAQSDDAAEAPADDSPPRQSQAGS